MIPRWVYIAVIACLVLGIFFRAYNLDRKAYWEDEMLGTMRMIGYTEASIVKSSPQMTRASDVQAYLQLPSDRSQDSLRNTVTALASEDPQHPPVYYLLGHLWAEAFGTSLDSIRSLPVLFGILALPCVFWLALELFESRLTAILALGLVATSPVFVLYSQEAREYSLWTVVIALASTAFLRAIRTGKLMAWSIYCASLLIGLYIYPLTALVVVGYGVYLLANGGVRLSKSLYGYVVALIVAACAFAPWLLAMVHSPGVAKGMNGIVSGRLTLGTRGVAIAHIFTSPFADFSYIHENALSTARNGAFTVLATALALYSLCWLIRTQQFRTWGFVLVALCLPTIPLMFYSGLVFQTRYFTPLLLGVVLSVAALFASHLSVALGERRGVTAWGAAFVAVLVIQVISCSRSSQADTWWNKAAERSKAVATVVNQAESPLVISHHTVSSLLGLAYYLNPDVPLRVDLQCSQCSVLTTPRPDILADTGAYRNVFVLDVPGEVAWNPRFRIIDPRPFPPRGVALTMFQRAFP